MKQLLCENKNKDVTTVAVEKTNNKHKDVCYHVRHVNDKQIVIIVENLQPYKYYDIIIKTNAHEYWTSVRIYGMLI